MGCLVYGILMGQRSSWTFPSAKPNIVLCKTANRSMCLQRLIDRLDNCSAPLFFHTLKEFELRKTHPSVRPRLAFTFFVLVVHTLPIRYYEFRRYQNVHKVSRVFVCNVLVDERERKIIRRTPSIRFAQTSFPAPRTISAEHSCVDRHKSIWNGIRLHVKLTTMTTRVHSLRLREREKRERVTELLTQITYPMCMNCWLTVSF